MDRKCTFQSNKSLNLKKEGKKTHMRDYLLLLITLFFSGFSQIGAKEIHALLTADTISEVKVATVKDLKHIKKELQTIASATSMNLRAKVLNGSHLTKEVVSKWVEDSNIQSDDIVFFYFTGHGLRTDKNQTIWPCIYFPPKKEIVDFCEIIDKLTSKRAALCIIIADCCNNFIKAPISFAQKAQFKAKNENHATVKHMYKQLFTNTQGVIIASGSTPGKRSWCTQKGSIFTNALISSLKHELEESDPKWERVLNKAKIICQNFQKPQFHLYIQQGKGK